VPATVTVTAGPSKATFPVWTSRTKKTRTVTISASYDGRSFSAKLTVTR